MNPLFVALPSLLLAAGPPVQFERHDIDSFPGGYQVAVTDVNVDGKPDVVALSTQANRVDWYENPQWTRRGVARTARNIDLAPRDLDGDGRPEIALASGFYFSESLRGGEIHLLSRPSHRGDTERAPPNGRAKDRWRLYPIAVDPVVHRLRWGDLDGDGRPELVHAPIFGPGSAGAGDPKPAHLWAFRVPRKLGTTPWESWKIDETLTVLHGLYVCDLDGDGKDEILTASFEGIHRFDFVGPCSPRLDGPCSSRLHGQGLAARWRKVRISAGAKPADQKPGTSRGSSEVAPGRLGPRLPFLAAIEPWHGHEVVVYTPAGRDGRWQRRVLDDSLTEGHALVVADFDADGADEIVAGWRGAGGGLALYDPVDAAGHRFVKVPIDRQIPAEGAVAADLNLDGKLDVVVIAGRSNKLAWYENRR